MPRFLFLPIYSFTLWDAKHAPQGDETIQLSLANSEYILRILISYKEIENLDAILFCRAIFRPIIFHSL